MTITKEWLIQLAKKHGVTDATKLESSQVTLQNFVFKLRENKYEVDEGFFIELADALGLQYIPRMDLKADLAAAIPYLILKENLFLPLSISEGRVRVATANPFNSDFFNVLKSLFGAEVEVCVASTEAVEEAIDKGYSGIHERRALKELRYRSPDESAFRVLYPWQRSVILGFIILFSVLFVLNYPLSFIVLFSLINIAYFCVNPVKFYIAFKGFRGSRRAVHVSSKDVESLQEKDLPVYTILVPVYREAKALRHVLKNIYSLDYPKEKLDVKILIEEKDDETLGEARRIGLFGNPETVVAPPGLFGRATVDANILSPSMKILDRSGSLIGTLEEVIPGEDPSEALIKVRTMSGGIMEIPLSFVGKAQDVILLKDSIDRLTWRYKEFLKIFDPVIVPDADIRTKPRACNYGLLRARGEYCVIYDAEDDPEPDQLKKAVVAFSRASMDVICLQSRLNYYNPKENLLTRWFSLEYSFWYDYYLEGLDQVDGVIPLGGTSNHFRTQQLKELGGWDPYNMTEDADLGVRISRRGKKTAMLNSYTYEEANSRLRSWIRQRSRWNKGYIQTYLVHMRHPRKLLKDLGWRKFLLFQLTFGGNIYLPLINPLLWAVTISTLLMPGLFQFLFFYPLNYICATNLLIGNLVYIGLHMGPFILKKNYTSIPLALAIPLYWILISVGCWRGALQLIRKPFYWEKTEHGISRLHGLPEK
ncbi:MAG: glycosyltransferase [Candidatus Bathyarchaeia archaeon]|nr:glycosyltransferase [Candidatus Bathyarchaeota archaeon]